MVGHDEPMDSPKAVRNPQTSTEQALDLIGGPFAVIESDPGVFTSLAKGLGVKRVEVVEIYDIEPWAVDHLEPYGLIFCFTWHKDTHRPADFDDPAAEQVWFANQLSDDACATHAILNVLFNCPKLELGEELQEFRRETKDFSPIMRGLAMTNSPLLRRVHNSLARPSDIRAALSTTAMNTLNLTRSQTAKGKGKARGRPSSHHTKDQTEENENQTYHFIGYVPAFGKVWELDGLKSGPLEVGELASEMTSEGWMDVARPALRLKMAKYGGSGSEDSNIHFSLLAIVPDMQLKAIDDLEFLKREKRSIENRLRPGWEEMVDQTIREASLGVFDYEIPEDYQQPIGFSGRRMERDIEIMRMSQRKLESTWNLVMRDAVRAKVALEDEIRKRIQRHTEQIKRTFDYEPFIKEFVTGLHTEGLLFPILNLDENGKKIPMSSPKKKRT